VDRTTRSSTRPDEIRVKVLACGVCRTDLHVVDGELPDPMLPIIPGHEIVGRIDAMGIGVKDLQMGERVGIPWLGHTDGTCPYCLMHRENLCDHPLFTGFTRDGGYATAVIADARFAFPLGEVGSDISIAPLLCAGLIGWRSLVIAGEAKKIGFYGFGAAAHILAQVARWQGRSVYAFTRAGDAQTQTFAKSLGAIWAGDSDDSPPEPLDAAIIFAPVGALVPTALKAVRKGGRVVCAGIHMSDIRVSLSYVVGRARATIRRQSDAQGRTRLPATDPHNRHQGNYEAVSPASSKPSTRGLAWRTV
jgi:propanol-preferring alcohol dehydrogenase